jgi:outer membrane protein assembly factor BamB
LTVALGNVYFVAGDAYALNATTGAVVWKSQATYTEPVALFVNNGVLYMEMQTEASIFSALNATNGKLLWGYVIGSYGSSFALVQGVLYIATSPFPALSAVQVSNGSQIWMHEYGGYGGVSTPIVTGGIVTVGYASDDGSGNYRYEIDAFNSSNGSLAWQSQNVYQLGASQGMVYAAVAGSNVVEALNALNGALIWKNSIGTGNVTQVGEIVRNGVLYTSNSNNEVDAINTADGSLLWHYNVGGSVSRLIIANGVVYARGSELYALKASNGSFLWKASISGILCAVSVKLGIVYIENSVISHPLTSALSIKTGQLLWTY